jgi:LysM repeat protein
MPTHLKMNDQSPLIPQGSLLEQKNKTRVRVKLAVIFVLALHGIGLLALLMQGCGHENAGAPGSGPAGSNAPSAGMNEPAAAPQTPAFAPPSNPAPETTSTTSTLAGSTSPPSATIATNPVQPTPPPETAAPSPTAPPSGATDYKVLKGDTLFKIARKMHVTLSALTAANPGVDSRKLKPDQVIHVPPQTAAAAGAGAARGAAAEGAGGEQVYTVKSNDSLTRIAHQFDIKVKALRAANHLKTDKIKVGQKLTIPARSAASTEAAPAAPGQTNNPPPAPGR